MTLLAVSSWNHSKAIEWVNGKFFYCRAIYKFSLIKLLYYIHTYIKALKMAQQTLRGWLLQPITCRGVDSYSSALRTSHQWESNRWDIRKSFSAPSSDSLRSCAPLHNRILVTELSIYGVFVLSALPIRRSSTVWTATPSRRWLPTWRIRRAICATSSPLCTSVRCSARRAPRCRRATRPSPLRRATSSSRRWTRSSRSAPQTRR